MRTAPGVVLVEVGAGNPDVQLPSAHRAGPALGSLQGGPVAAPRPEHPSPHRDASSESSFPRVPMHPESFLKLLLGSLTYPPKVTTLLSLRENRDRDFETCSFPPIKLSLPKKPLDFISKLVPLTAPRPERLETLAPATRAWETEQDFLHRVLTLLQNA